MCVKKIIEKEIQDNQYLLEQIQDVCIRERAAYCLKWYTNKAVKNKYYFYILTSLTIICPVVSGILLGVSSWEGWKILSAALMGISTVSAALLTMLDARRKWGIYRNQAEEVKHLLANYRFFASEEDFLTELEKSMNATHEKWIKPFRAANETDSEKGEKEEIEKIEEGTAKEERKKGEKDSYVSGYE